MPLSIDPYEVAVRRLGSGPRHIDHGAVGRHRRVYDTPAFPVLHMPPALERDCHGAAIAAGLKGTANSVLPLEYIRWPLWRVTERELLSLSRITLCSLVAEIQDGHCCFLKRSDPASDCEEHPLAACRNCGHQKRSPELGWGSALLPRRASAARYHHESASLSIGREDDCAVRAPTFPPLWCCHRWEQIVIAGLCRGTFLNCRRLRQKTQSIRHRARRKRMASGRRPSAGRATGESVCTQRPDEERSGRCRRTPTSTRHLVRSRRCDRWVRNSRRWSEYSP